MILGHAPTKVPHERLHGLQPATRHRYLRKGLLRLFKGCGAVNWTYKSATINPSTCEISWNFTEVAIGHGYQMISIASEIISSCQTLLIVSNVCSQSSLPHSDIAADFSDWPWCWSRSDSTTGLENRCRGFHTLTPRELWRKDIERCCG